MILCHDPVSGSAAPRTTAAGLGRHRVDCPLEDVEHLVSFHVRRGARMNATATAHTTGIAASATRVSP